ncbi:MAG: glycosyltransferase family 87 protein [Chthoniobacterales bacterium]
MKAAFRVLIPTFVVVVLIFAAIPIANAVLGKSIKDYELWYDTGQRVLHGDAIYPVHKGKFPFMYPPPAALMLAPVSLLGKTGVVVALVLVNAAAWLTSILLSVRLTSGESRGKHWLVYAVPSLLVIVYVWSNFHLGQPSILILGLLLGAFFALEKKHQLAAGALIAVAAAIKAFPVITIVYLLYRRYWLAAASLIFSLVFLLIILPAPIRGFTQTRTDLQKWTQGMLFKYNEKGLAQRPGRSNSWKNQSIFGLTNRMLRHIDADDQYRAHEPFYANFADISFKTVNYIIVAAGLVLGLVYLAVMPRRDRRTNETNALEFALLILLMLLFTPLAFGYLFVCLLFPFTVVVHRLLEYPSRSLWICAIVAVVLLALALPFQRMAQTYGNTFFATLTLFAGLAIELWRMKIAAPVQPAT